MLNSITVLVDLVKKLKVYKYLCCSYDGQLNNKIDYWMKNLNESTTLNYGFYCVFLLAFGWFVAKILHALLNCYKINGDYFKNHSLYLKHQKLIQKALQTIQSANQFNTECTLKIKELYPEVNYLDVNEFGDNESIEFFDLDSESRTTFFQDVYNEVNRFAETSGKAQTQSVEDPPTIVNNGSAETKPLKSRNTRARYSSRYGKYVKPPTSECSCDDLKRGIFSRRATTTTTTGGSSK